MGEFLVRVATPADADRLWPLFDEFERQRVLLAVRRLFERGEHRRARLVTVLLDMERPVIVAYSGVRAVGFLLRPVGTPFVSADWRGLGVAEELLDFIR